MNPSSRPLIFEPLEKRELFAFDIDWSARIGGNGYEEARAVVSTSDGGFVAAGWTNHVHGGTNEDVLVTKVDSRGKLVWLKTFGGEQLDRAYSIVPAGDGFLVAGRTRSFGDIERCYVLRLDAGGNLVWQNTYGQRPSSGIRNIHATSDGNYIATGWTGDARNDDSDDTLLFKLDPDGNVLWWRDYPEERWQQGHEVIQAPDGGFMIAGIARPYRSDARQLDGRITKTDANGNVEWWIQTKRVGWDEWHGMTLTNDGYVFSGGQVIRGVMRTHMMRITFTGQLVWDHFYREFGYSWHVTSDGRGGFLATGSITPVPELPPDQQAKMADTFVLDVDANGNRVAGQYIGGAFNDEARYVLTTDEGKIIVVGYLGLEDGTKPSSNTQPDWNRDLWIYQLRWSVGKRKTR